MQTTNIVAILALAAGVIGGGAAGPARADDPIMLRGGQWTSTVSGTGPAPVVASYCLQDATLDSMQGGPQAAKACSRREFTRIPGGMKVDMVCGNVTMTGTTLSTGTDAYRSEMTMTMASGQTMHVTTETHRTGPCNAGEKPLNAR